MYEHEKIIQVARYFKLKALWIKYEHSEDINKERERQMSFQQHTLFHFHVFYFFFIKMHFLECAFHVQLLDGNRFYIVFN